ncbi:hypothetical protein [Paucisalibacillus globulus]|uniref:hypothetical protein n=1 Tax=Paucisalibacillus globulus TaxID=351095 RepID=UPI0003F7AB48|nr:hypothetical protein [Paucisalibacillus globulus]
MNYRVILIISFISLLIISGCSDKETTSNSKGPNLTEEEQLEQRIQSFLDEVTNVIMEKDFENFYQMWIQPEFQSDSMKKEIRELFDSWHKNYEEYNFEFIEIAETLEADGYTFMIVFVDAKMSISGREDNGKASVTIVEVDNEWGFTFDFDGVRFIREE